VRLSSAANLNNGNDPVVIDIEQLTPEQLKAIKERGVESVEISEEANENGEYDIVLHLGGTEPARPARRRPLHGADTLGQFYQVQAQQDNIDGLLSDAELNAIYEAQFQGAVTGAMFLLPVDETFLGVYILGKTVNGLVRLGSSVARFVRTRAAAKRGAKRIDYSFLRKPRTGSANKDDPHHGFNDIIDNFTGAAEKFDIPTKGPGGEVVRTSELRQIEGSLNGRDGVFEWIVDQGNVTHRRFIPGGKVTGFPNQVPKK